MTDLSDRPRPELRAVVAPLVLAQFIASYAGTNMNVAINDIAADLHTDVRGVQTVITIFTLTMAALMIPGSKLTEIWGRKRCFRLGLLIYGLGALIAAFAQGLTLLLIGYSLLEGVGSALMIPPIYILITVWFAKMGIRARYFGAVSAAAGIGAAAGPLIGGLITTSISWRASFVVQALVVFAIIYSSRKIKADDIATPRPKLDVTGSVLSAAGLFFIVLGILQAGTYGWFKSREDWSIGGVKLISAGGLSPVWIYVAVGTVVLLSFLRHIRSWERANKEPLLSMKVFHNRMANLGLITQNIQWLTLQGGFFVISVFVQTIRGLSAVQTGLVLTPATAGILASSVLAERFARRRSQATLVRAGFVMMIAGLLLILALVRADSNILTFVPGLVLMGLGIGIMLTSSVNVVQSSFDEKSQGEISGLSRSVSNLGSSLGTAIAGSVLVSTLVVGNKRFAFALITLIGFGLIGTVAAFLLPTQSQPPPAQNTSKENTRK